MTMVAQAPPAEQPARQAGWLATIDGVGSSLWNLLGDKLAEALQVAGVPHGGSVVWVPQGALGQVPIGLVKHPTTGELLLDRYTLVLAPNLAVLETSRRRAEASPAPASLAAVVNPTGDLAFTVPEGMAAASYFQKAGASVLGASNAGVANCPRVAQEVQLLAFRDPWRGRMGIAARLRSADGWRRPPDGRSSHRSGRHRQPQACRPVGMRDRSSTTSSARSTSSSAFRVPFCRPALLAWSARCGRWTMCRRRC